MLGCLLLSGPAAAQNVEPRTKAHFGTPLEVIDAHKMANAHFKKKELEAAARVCRAALLGKENKPSRARAKACRVSRNALVSRDRRAAMLS